MTQTFSLHEKINLRSHFGTDKEKRALVPYDESACDKIRSAGHTVLEFKTTPYGVRIQGTRFNRRGSKLKH